MNKQKIQVGYEGAMEELEVTVPDGDPLPWDAASDLKIVGKPTPRLDAVAKVTGRARYTFDVALPGLLQARVLRNKLELFTPHTVTNPSLLLDEFARIREQGWATAPDQIVVGLNTLACPIFDASGRVCGAIGIVDMVQQIGATPSELHIRESRRAAKRISERLGFAGTVEPGSPG